MLLCRGRDGADSSPWGVPHPPTRPYRLPLELHCRQVGVGKHEGRSGPIQRADWGGGGTLVWGQGPLGW